MKTTEKKQKAKVGVAGSFFNQIMSNNSSVPEVGKGATLLHYTDRTCFDVIEVSPDGRTARLQYLNAEADRTKTLGEGHQNWILKPVDRFLTVTWRHRAWRTVGSEIVFTDKFMKECEEKGIYYIGHWMRKNNPELADKIWAGEIHPQNVIEGYTIKKTVYHKINILFGVKNYYYDWSF